MSSRLIRFALAAGAAGALAAPAAAAPTLTLVASGFSQSLATVFAPDGRQFVVEQGGRIVELLAGGTQRTFMTVPNLATGGEKGLLNLAFPADFATSRRFFVYTTGTDTHGRLQVQIRRYRTVGSSNTDFGNPATGVKLLTYLKPFDNHNGGWMAFGPDGYLYLGTGDGGSGNDPNNNAQNLGVLLGKILRIDVSGPGAPTIPPTNPFINTKGAKKEIFAFGMRNPFRSSFDRATGDLYIGDVGQDSREEVDVIKAGTSGQNFGWRVREGKIQNPAYAGVPVPAGAVDPIYDYPHGGNKTAGQGNDVTGGYVYHGSVASLQGRYIFADFVDGGFWSIDTSGGGFQDMSSVWSAAGGSNPVSFGENAAGELYVVDYAGKVFRLDDK